MTKRFIKPFYPFAVACAVAAIILMSLMGPHAAHAADKVKVKKNGKETLLDQKLISLMYPTLVYPEPQEGGRVRRTGIYDIFFQLKTDSGKEEDNGFYRIGDNAGESIGWVKKDSVVRWATRYAIRPQWINEKLMFTVTLPSGAIFGYDERGDLINSTTFGYCFILADSKGKGEDAEDVGPFPVTMALKSYQDPGTAAELDQIGEMELQMFFVVENSRYLMCKYPDQPFFNYLHKLGKHLAEGTEKLDSEVPVEFGLIMTGDTNSDFAPNLRPVVRQPLTRNLNDWQAQLKQLRGMKTDGDYENDGLSGVDLAVNDNGWKGNTSKHIIFLGNSTWQRWAFRQDPTGPPLKNYLSWAFKRDDTYLWDDDSAKGMFGTNTCGKQVDQVVREAFPNAASLGERIRGNKNLHAIHIGATTKQFFSEKLVNSATELNELYNNEWGHLPPLKQLPKINEEDNLPIHVWKIEAWDLYDQMSQNQFQALATTSPGEGYYTHMEANEQDVQRVVKELYNKIKSTIRLIDDIGKGKDVSGTENKSNEMTKPIFTLLNASKNDSKINKDEAQTGESYLVDQKTGRSVGIKMVLVTKTELARLESAFGSLYGTFVTKKKAVDRKDVKDILADLQRALAETTAGQNQGMEEDTELASVITDLPLRTEALSMTPTDISIMSTKAFELWLMELNDAESSIKNLRTSTEGWRPMASLVAKRGSKAAEFNFVTLSQLP